jgi:hypothetical protein
VALRLRAPVGWRQRRAPHVFEDDAGRSPAVTSPWPSRGRAPLPWDRR